MQVSLRLWLLLSIAVVAISIYMYLELQYADWGAAGNKINIALIVPVSMIFMYGITMALQTALGFMGMYYKTHASTAKSFSGYLILRVYALSLFALIICEIVMLSYIYELVTVTRNPTGDFKTMEPLFAFIFNNLFFANALRGTTAFDSDIFWSFVEYRCPPGMWEKDCYKDFTYSIGSGKCPADEYTCNTLQGGNGSACPYNRCRAPIANFSVDMLGYLSAICFSFMVMHVIVCSIALHISLATKEIAVVKPMSDEEATIPEKPTLIRGYTGGAAPSLSRNPSAPKLSREATMSVVAKNGSNDSVDAPEGEILLDKCVPSDSPTHVEQKKPFFNHSPLHSPKRKHAPVVTPETQKSRQGEGMRNLESLALFNMEVNEDDEEEMYMKV